MEVTLHVDLLWTDLEDFVEHFENILHSARVNILLGDKSGWLLWSDELYPENPGFRGWELLDSGTYTRIRIFNQGTTGKTYWILKGAKGEPEIPQAVVSAARYRRDRLKLILHESNRWGYAERLQRWLNDTWEDAAKINESRNIPQPISSEQAPLMPNRAKNEHWFGWFKWYYRQVWEPGEMSIRHMARLNGKSESQNEKMHSLYMDGMKPI